MHKDDINKLALWQKIQRINFHLGLLPQKKIDTLESIGGWDWDCELEPHTIKYLNTYKNASDVALYSLKKEFSDLLALEGGIY